MVNKLETYLDFAENDYQHFKFCYKATLVTNQMGAIAQGICEKYLKHVIEEYVIVDNAQKNGEKEKILRTHSVRRHIVGGANRTLISVKTPSRSCRIGT